MSYKKEKPTIIKESGWTIEDYYKLPEDGNHYEIVSGHLELRPSPTTTHQRISHRIERILTDSCESEYIILDAPVDVILSETDTRQPDILMIHRSREEIIEEHAVVGPPDLVVEILSPSTAKRDRTMKRDSYAQFGVMEYWIVDHLNQTIEQYVLTETGKPYELANVFDRDDIVTSQHLTCVSFAVKNGLTL
ncbi:Uma2 family endonuclease [Bacillus fonticola]|uniref:Uma2 family endonuclease n=1 Tax=Bacillus fonticola TaxID=2728853 RepID=UPI0014759B74|nr:Uma2 family endonuclease [Bacillus fonticola]